MSQVLEACNIRSLEITKQYPVNITMITISIYYHNSRTHSILYQRCHWQAVAPTKFDVWSQSNIKNCHLQSIKWSPELSATFTEI